eukprot:Pompholyxophrys_punicea_v1_NODE_28_length_5163_cov_5.731206.p6 type:complete len:161 gc:universal NODE_28_length_5163_cov_5.731206:1529-1047(-)
MPQVAQELMGFIDVNPCALLENKSLIVHNAAFATDPKELGHFTGPGQFQFNTTFGLDQDGFIAHADTATTFSHRSNTEKIVAQFWHIQDTVQQHWHFTISSAHHHFQLSTQSAMDNFTIAHSDMFINCHCLKHPTFVIGHVGRCTRINQPNAVWNIIITD